MKNKTQASEIQKRKANMFQACIRPFNFNIKRLQSGGFRPVIKSSANSK